MAQSCEVRFAIKNEVSIEENFGFDFWKRKTCIYSSPCTGIIKTEYNLKIHGPPFSDFFIT